MSPQESPPHTLGIQLLGGFQVWVEGEQVSHNAWKLRKAGAIVKLLALSRHHSLHREYIVDALWPDLPPDAAANNFRYALYTARRTLGSSPHILSVDRDQLHLAVDTSVYVDVDAFDAAASAARVTKDPAAYRSAIELYSGELLPEDVYEEWTEPARAQLRLTFLGLLCELAELYERQGETALAVEALDKLVKEEPTHEEAHCRLMSLYAATGRRQQALSQYERLASILERELDAEPGEIARSLHEQILESPVEVTFPVLKRQRVPTKHNLPEPLTSFIGRGGEVAELRRLLDKHRLVTLAGAGGSGKTRLALVVAGELVDEYPDGVWLVELANLTDPALVAQEVAGLFGLSGDAARGIPDMLLEWLRPARMLLVLDNCEHLVEETAVLVDRILRNCPGVRILATSRELLGVGGEMQHLVPPLRVPDITPMHPVELVGQAESVRLFVERARLRRPDFALTEQNIQSVVRICQRLDGLPLAIELAAGRVGVLAVEQIADHIDNALALLSSGSRSAGARQRTLEGALDWSYDLLQPGERKLLSRVGVFAGGWTLEAASSVCSGDGIAEREVLELLSQLVQKSLVQVDPGRRTARYHLLEVVRQYAREKLASGSESRSVERRHAEYYARLAARAEPELVGVEQAEWLNRLEAEHDNLRAALSWGLEEEPELALRIADAVWRLWDIRGYLVEGRRWLERALERCPAAPPALRAQALSALGTLAWHQGDYGAAEQLHSRSLALYKDLGDQGQMAICFNNLGVQAYQQGDQDRAMQLYEKGLEVAEGSGYLLALSMLLHNLAVAALDNRAYDRARELFERCVQLARELGQEHHLLVGLHNLGEVLLNQGDYSRALDCQLEALALCAHLDSITEACFILEEIAGAYAALGETERAVRLLGSASRLREATHTSIPPSYQAKYYDTLLGALRMKLDSAAFAVLWDEGRAMTVDEAIQYGLRGRVELGKVRP